MVLGYRRRLSNLFMALSDILLVNLGIAIAFWLRNDYYFMGKFLVNKYNLEPYFDLIPLLSIMSLVVFYMFDLYTDWRRKSIHNLIYSVVLSVVTIFVLTVAATFWLRGFSFPRSVILISAVLQVVLLVSSRSLFWYFSKRRYGQRKVLILGKDIDDSMSIAHKFLTHSRGWFVVRDFLTYAHMDELREKLPNADVVIISANLDRQKKAEIISQCVQLGKEVLVVPELFELFMLDSSPQQVDDMLVLSIQPPHLHAGQRLIKRLFDVAVSLISIIIVSPVMLLLFIIIPLTSTGRAIYKQERLGCNERPYNIYKFRSMYEHAEKKTGPVLATENDMRITKIGRFIRATRLDEIPQLFNVLKGDMSLVGPRPEREFFIEQFKGYLPDYVYRMSVKPGVTGLAQVMAKYSTTVEDKLRFDLMYVRNYSFALDLRILFQTIRVVLQREQANGVKQLKESEKEELMSMFGLTEVANGIEAMSSVKQKPIF